VHSISIAIVATTRRELQHHHHHKTTRGSSKKERKEGERTKVKKGKKKKRKRESGREIESVKWHACTNRLIHSLPLKAYPLLRIKDSFGHKPKWIIFIAGSSYEVTHIEEVVPSLVLVP